MQYQRITMLADLRAAIAAVQESNASPEACVQSMREALDRRARCHEEFIERFAKDYFGTAPPKYCGELRGRIGALNEAVLLAADGFAGRRSDVSRERLDEMLVALVGATEHYEEDIEMCCCMASARSKLPPMPPPLPETWEEPPWKRKIYS